MNNILEKENIHGLHLDFFINAIPMKNYLRKIPLLFVLVTLSLDAQPLIISGNNDLFLHDFTELSHSYIVCGRINYTDYPF